MGLIPKTGEQHLIDNNNINHNNKTTKQKNSNNLNNTIDYKKDYTINHNQKNSLVYIILNLKKYVCCFFKFSRCFVVCVCLL